MKTSKRRAIKLRFQREPIGRFAHRVRLEAIQSRLVRIDDRRGLDSQARVAHARLNLLPPEIVIECGDVAGSANRAAPTGLAADLVGVDAPLRRLASRADAKLSLPWFKLRWSPELTLTFTLTNDLTIFEYKQAYKSGSYNLIVPVVVGASGNHSSKYLLNLGLSRPDFYHEAFAKIGANVSLDGGAPQRIEQSHLAP